MNTPSAAREQELVSAFVRLADTLVADYDVIDLFHGLCGDCVTLLGADAAGLLLTDQRGALQVVSASSEAANLVELFQIQSEQGPCLDCFNSSAQVHAGDLNADGRWPRFAARAADHGFVAVHALPMRLRGQTIGALNLFHRRSTTMASDDLAVGQALADVATIAILSDRNTRERERLTEQLQAALTSRVIIEQAKGILAERGQIALDDAFTRLRSHARSSQQRLSDLARAVIDGSLDTAPLLT
jgi:transcriptional regulator with GAF, ATPase, and Fis domain